MRAFAAFALIAFACPTVPASHGAVIEEIGEPLRAMLNARGQRNGLDEPAHVETLVLDAFHGLGREHPWAPSRATGGWSPALVAPGHGNLFAWYGSWEDFDADGEIDEADWELIAIDARLVAYLDPAARPQVAQNREAPPNEPDFDLRRAGDHYEGAGLGFVSATGSLAETLETRVLANPDLRFAGDDALACPASCLLDIDRYAALAPAPVASLYAATLAPVERALPPVSFAAVAWVERAFAATPVAGPFADVARAAAAATFAEAEDEWEPENGASQALLGRSAYLNETRHAFDARFVAAVPAPGAVATAPDLSGGTFLAVEATIVLWRDRDEDGAIDAWETFGACPVFEGRPVPLAMRATPLEASGGEVAVAFTYASHGRAPGTPTGEVLAAGVPIEDTLACDPADRGAGLYRSSRLWWFPAGAPALRLEVGSPKSPAANVTHESNGYRLVEWFWDADRRPRTP
ncbi:MAG TPA: hypothetical protein VM889_04130 [Candidatus Thermoplasmatota archaeon]|nr:hypothetical protein [Candidatus Thermoplasmatota archaeon]